MKGDPRHMQATKDAVEGSEAYKKMGQLIHDTVHGAVGEISIPGKHAFLFERVLEFNASVPCSGFSAAFLDAMNRPGRFDKEARRKAYITLEALFCLLPEAKKVRVAFFFFLFFFPALSTAFCAVTLSCTHANSARRLSCMCTSSGFAAANQWPRMQQDSP
jgi:hypothetical protein